MTPSSRDASERISSDLILVQRAALRVLFVVMRTPQPQGYICVCIYIRAWAEGIYARTCECFEFLEQMRLGCNTARVLTCKT